MGQQESKPEDIVAIANQPVSYSPPLGPPVRVSSPRSPCRKPHAARRPRALRFC
jgi:hypothetical protein